MARVTAEEVKDIMSNCTVADAVVKAIIDAANEVVTNTFSDNTTLSDNLLKEIERFYSAHILASTDLYRIPVEETVGPSKVKYPFKVGAGLDGTPYGKVVSQLDTTGKMAVVHKKEATIRAITSFDD